MQITSSYELKRVFSSDDPDRDHRAYGSRDFVMTRRRDWDGVMPALLQDLSQTLHLDDDCFGI